MAGTNENTDMFDEEEEQVKNEETLDDVDWNNDNVIKILVATDIHLGYEQTTKRGLIILMNFPIAIRIKIVTIFDRYYFTLQCKMMTVLELLKKFFKVPSQMMLT